MNKKRSDKQKSCQAEVPLTMKDMLRVVIQSWVLITVFYFVVSYSVVKKIFASYPDFCHFFWHSFHCMEYKAASKSFGLQHTTLRAIIHK